MSLEVKPAEYSQKNQFSIEEVNLSKKEDLLSIMKEASIAIAMESEKINHLLGSLIERMNQTHQDELIGDSYWQSFEESIQEIASVLEPANDLVTSVAKFINSLASAIRPTFSNLNPPRT